MLVDGVVTVYWTLGVVLSVPPEHAPAGPLVFSPVKLIGPLDAAPV